MYIFDEIQGSATKGLLKTLFGFIKNVGRV
jgi:hypothetical protein